MTEPLLPTRFLFRLSAPCRYRDPLWTPKGTQLDESYRLVGLAQLEERHSPADVRVAWSEAGLAFAVHVRGKTQPPWCRESRTEDSDGFHIWVDTRDVHNVHRAGRFCQRFVFLPGGAGRNLSQPVAETLPINRAREPAAPVPSGLLRACCERIPDGYILKGLIPSEAMHGFDPIEYPRLGFNYALIDRELGEQTFGVGSPMPYQEDPSLWPTIELQR